MARPDVIERANAYIGRCEQEQKSGRASEWAFGPVDLVRDLRDELTRLRAKLKKEQKVGKRSGSVGGKSNSPEPKTQI